MKNNKRLNDIARNRRIEFTYYCIAAVLITIFVGVI